MIEHESNGGSVVVIEEIRELLRFRPLVKPGFGHGGEAIQVIFEAFAGGLPGSIVDQAVTNVGGERLRPEFVGVVKGGGISGGQAGGQDDPWARAEKEQGIEMAHLRFETSQPDEIRKASV
jgi:hypothetical protein